MSEQQEMLAADELYQTLLHDGVDELEAFDTVLDTTGYIPLPWRDNGEDEAIREDTDVTLMNEAQRQEYGDWLFDTSGKERPSPTWPDREVFVKMPHFYLRFRPEDLVVVEEAGFDTRCPVTMEAQADALAVILAMMTMCGNA